MKNLHTEKIDSQTKNIVMSVIAFGALTMLLMPKPTAAACDIQSIQSQPGFFGLYYNLSNTDEAMDKSHKDSIADPLTGQNPWYVSDNFVFNKIDKDINFRSRFLPVKTGKPGDPFNFAVYWRAMMVVDDAGFYGFTVTADDDAWLIIDRQMVIDLGGTSYGMRGKSGTANLTKGNHFFELYYADRKSGGAGVILKRADNLRFYALPDSCSSVPTALAVAKNEPVLARVLGAETPKNISYTPAVALYRTIDSPDIYAIYANGFKHYISGPTAFKRYGYKHEDIKIVSTEKLAGYPDARLLRTPDSSTVYYLYTRPNKQWLKIVISSPTVFVSYPDNYWGNVVVVDELDILSYPDAKLVKVDNRDDIFLLQGNTRRRITSLDALRDLGFNIGEVVEVSQIHLESYRPAEPVTKT